MSVLTQTEWIALAVSLIGHYYTLYIASMWTNKDFMEKFEISRRMIRSFFAPPGWAAQPILFCVSGFLTASVFLFWRDHYDSSSDRNFALIMSFHFASVFLLQLWSTSASWGAKWWWFTVGDSVLLTATSTVVWAIMGVENAWLPFGLYSVLPVVAFLSIAVSAGFAVDSSLIGERAINMALGSTFRKGGNIMHTTADVLDPRGAGYTSMGKMSSGRSKRAARAYAM